MSEKIGDYIAGRVTDSYPDGTVWAQVDHDTELTGDKFDLPVLGESGREYVLEVKHTILTGEVDFEIQIQMIRFGLLTPHERSNNKNLDTVRAGWEWNDKPFLAAWFGGILILLDGATRSAKLINEYGEKAFDLEVPVVVVDVDDLRLQTFLGQEELLIKDDVWEMVFMEELVEPKQTRFGFEINGVCFSAAEALPDVVVKDGIC